MKRIVSVLLIISCLISLSACAKRDGTEPTNKYEDSVALFCNLLVYDLKDIRGFAPNSFWDYMKNDKFSTLLHIFILYLYLLYLHY